MPPKTKSAWDFIPMGLFTGAMIMAFWMGVELTAIRTRLTAIEVQLTSAQNDHLRHSEMNSWTKIFKAQNPDIIVPDIPSEK